MSVTENCFLIFSTLCFFDIYLTEYTVKGLAIYDTYGACN